MITNEGNWEGYITQVVNKVSVKTDGHKMFFICDKLVMLDTVHDSLMIRSIWCIHPEIDEKTNKENMKILQNGKKPDFSMIRYCSLPSLFSYSATVDSEYIANSPDCKKYAHTGAVVKFRKLIDESKLPTCKRQAFGLIYDTHKVVQRGPAMECLLEERPDFVAVPICIYGDLDAYNSYKLPVCIQKARSHYNKVLTDP